jgi:4-hydroxy-tetrahydrodipicolinate synthase
MSAGNFNFHGIITALITPFFEGEVDWPSYEKLLEFQLEQDIDGLVVNGTTGESPTLEQEEVLQLVKLTRKKMDSLKRPIPLILGSGSNGTQKTVALSRQAEDWGADALLVVAPYYNKPPQRGMIEHYKTVAKAVGVPVLLYNVPGRTMVSMTPETIAELSQVENIIGVKEATGDLDFGAKVLKAVPNGFLVTSGDDGTCMGLAKLGAQGSIAVCSHIIGDRMKEILKRVRAGETAALGEYEKYQKFISQLYTEANPIGIKMALHLMDVIKSPELRLPLMQLDQKYVNGLKTSMQELGLLNG